jgi:hypothetical protein
LRLHLEAVQAAESGAVILEVVQVVEAGAELEVRQRQHGDRPVRIDRPEVRPWVDVLLRIVLADGDDQIELDTVREHGAPARHERPEPHEGPERQVPKPAPLSLNGVASVFPTSAAVSEPKLESEHDERQDEVHAEVRRDR